MQSELRCAEPRRQPLKLVRGPNAATNQRNHEHGLDSWGPWVSENPVESCMLPLLQSLHELGQ